jgi:hypothetical protein
MDLYDEILNELKAGTKIAASQCSVEGPVKKTKTLLKAAKEGKSIWTDGFSSPTSILDGADGTKKLAIATKLEKLQKKLAAEKDQDIVARLLDEDAVLMKEQSEILSNYTQDQAIKSEIEITGREYLLAGEQIKAFDALNFSKVDDEYIPQIIGKGKDENFTTDYILNNLAKDIENAGESVSPTFNKYYAKEGAGAVEKVVATAKLFKSLGKVADLPEGKFLDAYFPSLTKVVDDMDDVQGALKDLQYIFKDSQEQYKKAFFDYKRTGEFGTNYGVKQSMSIYRKMAQKKVRHRYARNILEQVATRAEKEGWEARDIKAAHQIVKNMIEVSIPDATVSKIRGAKRFFQRFSLFGNIGSTVNNMTSIATMINPKFGTENTAKAFKLMHSDNALNDFLDDFNVGSADDALSSYDFQDGINHNSTHWMDVFSKSEQMLTRLTALSHLVKRFGSSENALAKLQQIDSIPDFKVRLDEYLKVVAPMKKDIADTLFHNKAFDKPPGANSPYYEVFNAAMTMIRHPIREAKQLMKVAGNLTNPKEMSREEAAKQITRYLTAKAMFMGKSSVWFAMPTPLMHYINEHAPEVRKNVEDVSSVLEKVAVFKMIGEKVGVDFEMSQHINWAPFLLFDAIKGDPQLASTQFYAKGVRAISNVFAGKADYKDGARIMSVAAAAKLGKLEGAIQVGKFAVGGRQFEKAAIAVMDILRGETEFFKVPRKVEDMEDIHEVIARGLFSLTPETAKIIRAKSPKAVDNQRMYIQMLSTSGKIDKDTFDDMLVAYGGSRTKLKKSLMTSIERMKLPRDLRNNARRAISGY